LFVSSQVESLCCWWNGNDGNPLFINFPFGYKANSSSALHDPHGSIVLFCPFSALLTAIVHYWQMYLYMMYSTVIIGLYQNREYRHTVIYSPDILVAFLGSAGTERLPPAVRTKPHNPCLHIRDGMTLYCTVGVSGVTGTGMRTQYTKEKASSIYAFLKRRRRTYESTAGLAPS
jgi:hypothetical protein